MGNAYTLPIHHTPIVECILKCRVYTHTPIVECILKSSDRELVYGAWAKHTLYTRFHSGAREKEKEKHKEREKRKQERKSE